MSNEFDPKIQRIRARAAQHLRPPPAPSITIIASTGQTFRLRAGAAEAVLALLAYLGEPVSRRAVE